MKHYSAERKEALLRQMMPPNYRKIEALHKILKSGGNAEQSRLRTADRFELERSNCKRDNPVSLLCRQPRIGMKLMESRTTLWARLFVLALTGGTCLFAQAQIYDQRCSSAIVSIVGEQTHLKNFAHPGAAPASDPDDASASDPEGKGLILSSACKQWPAGTGTYLSAFVYEGEGEFAKQLILALVDLSKRRIIASFQRSTNEDGSSEFGIHSLRLDPARYQLSKNVIAFGLRERTFIERCSYDGGSDNALTLFVIEGRAIRPVFRAYTSTWSYGPGNRCDGEIVDPSKTDSFISIEPTMSNGFADLKITSIERDRNVRSKRIEQYNGCFYVPKPWTKSPPCKHSPDLHSP